MPLDADRVRRTKIIKTILDTVLKLTKKSEQSCVQQFIGQYFSQIGRAHV